MTVLNIIKCGMRSAERFSYSQKLILSEIDIFNSAFPHFRSHTKLTNSCSLDNENVGSFNLFRSCLYGRILLLITVFVDDKALILASTSAKLKLQSFKSKYRR